MDGSMQSGAALKVSVVGAGFGRGLAVAAARAGSEVNVFTRRRLEPVKQPAGAAIELPTTTDYAAVAQADLIFLAVPSEYTPAVLGQLGDHLDGRHLVVHVSRGLVGEQLDTVCEVIKRETSVRRVGALAGPLGNAVLVDGNPGGAIVGTDFPEVAEAVRLAIGSERLRVYETDDRVGVEVGSALTGMLLFALGYAQGIGFGPSTVGVLASRGVSEIARIAELLGGRVETLSGLACLGDLVSAVAGDARPEIELGRHMANGASLDDALARIGTHVESTAVAARICRYADRQDTDLPITRAVTQVLEGSLSSTQAIKALMGRRVGRE